MTFSTEDYDFRNTIVNSFDDRDMLIHLLNEFNSIREKLSPIFREFIDSLLDDDNISKMTLEELKIKIQELKQISM